MKNIHILPTDKPSRFLYNSTLKSFCIQKEIDGMFINDGKVSGADFWGLEKALNNGFKPYNIYITSDEEIKEGDWTLMFDSFGHLFLSHRPQQYLGIEKGHHLNRGLRKIILTTDKDLIKDGVQSIHYTFLEWFVKNPSCEEVEVESWHPYAEFDLDYKIIIPKEEAKPHSFCETPEEKCTMNYCDENGCQNRKRELVEPKQETFEEAAERLAKDSYKKHYVKDDKLSLDEQIQRSGGFIVGFKEGMIEGAKWQQERMYSEEEVLEIIRQYDLEEHLITSSKPDIWFKQFKKK